MESFIPPEKPRPEEGIIERYLINNKYSPMRSDRRKAEMVARVPPKPTHPMVETWAPFDADFPDNRVHLYGREAECYIKAGKMLESIMNALSVPVSKEESKAALTIHRLTAHR